MTNQLRKKFLEKIQFNIDNYGHHMYSVSMGVSPRFVYTIGASQVIGSELILAGASFYSVEEAKKIINEIVISLKNKKNWDELSFKVDSLGTFSFQKVDSSWVDMLMLGALDFYDVTELAAWQIIPDKVHWTVDTPNCSQPWSAEKEPVWQWQNISWDFPIPSTSIAITNLDALRGKIITEASRWEENEWEMFAGAGPDVLKEEIRIVPLGVLLAVDKTLYNVIDLPIGSALWRDDSDLEWHPWE